MGVPKFFSWITKRYPLILQETQQGSLPDVDYLYLDMNGIIYKCSKDESIIFKSMVMSKEMEEIWLSIFNYISNIVDIIQPKKLLFLGLDGVAPRAKMNNQRSRRFNSAKSYAAMEQRLNDYGEKNEENFKNNCITPGTEFMAELNKQLRFFIQKKIQEDPEWQKFRVIFSGGDVPGEGEHKIMDFIREGCSQKIFSEESKHCLYGADADLIMLAMTLPIKNLCIIRQEFIFNKNSKAINISSTKNNVEVVFQLIYIRILKEYFELEYLKFKESMKHEYNIQRIINDFVFLCFFIGNDFLPRCYCYDIREGFLEKLIDGFKEFLINSETYLLGEENINLIELQRLTGILKRSEAVFIASRQEELRDFKELTRSNSDSDKEKQVNEGVMEATLEQPMKNQKEFILTLKTLYMNDDLAGAKRHFYKEKFGLDAETEDEKITNIIDTYLTGLNYVYQYYFKTLPSWEWFYPYYYAPLVNDLNVYLIYKNQNRIPVASFSKSEPFEPFKQLLCILPKQSYGLLPPCLQDLIKNEQSPLRTPFDYFPNEVKIDPYGGKQQHQFISILPFIDQNVVTAAYNNVDKSSFTDAEKERNIHVLNELYIYDPNQPLTKIKSFYHYISDFKVSIAIHPLNFLKDSLAIVTKGTQTEQPKQQEEYFNFPTLKIRQFESNLMINDRQFKGSYHLKLTVTPTEPQKPIKLGSIIYFGLPNERSGKVLAICTRSQLQSDSKDFDYRDYINEELYGGPTPRHLWEIFEEQIMVDFEKRRGISLKQSKILYFVMISKRNVRKRSGKFIRGYEDPSYAIVPDCLVYSHKKYSFTRTPFVPKDITEEFLLGEEVVVLNKDFCGSTGKVIGYTENLKKVRVEINRKPNRIPQAIIQKAKGNDFFWSLGFVARIFNVDLDTILVLIDSLPVDLDRNDPSAQGMPLAIDIGLNYIKRNHKQLVPTLVRLPLESSNITDINLFRQFKKLQLSTTALQLIYRYYMKYPQIFNMLNERCQRIKQQRGDWKERISVNDIWELDDSSRKAIQVYLWLIKQEEVHEPNSSINSTKISKSRINSLLDYFKQQKREEYHQVEELDPNYLYSTRLAKEGLLYLRNPPPNHRIGDRVVCINPQQFGQTAIVIGVGTEYRDLVFQVLFQNPSFGKDNLGGLVDYLWGGEYNYDQLFNMDSWTQDVQERGSSDGTGWDGSIPRFVNSDTFKNTSNKRAEVIERENYHKIVSKLQLEEGLVEFIKKAAERNPGRGYHLVTKRDQRGINNLQREEETLLDLEKSNEPKPKYVEKEEKQQKQEAKVQSEQVKVEKLEKVEQKQQQKQQQKQDQKPKAGEKVFKKHVFDGDSKGNNTQKRISYVEKPEKPVIQNTKNQGKTQVAQKVRYVEKKEEKQQTQPTTQTTPFIDISAVTIGNPTDKPKDNVISAQTFDGELDRYMNQPEKKEETAKESNNPPQSEVSQTKPTEPKQVTPVSETAPPSQNPQEQYDQEIFG